MNKLAFAAFFAIIVTTSSSAEGNTITMCSGVPGMATVLNNLTHVMSGTIETQQPCIISIPRQPGVCQLRVDFTEFNVGPMVGLFGNCPSDTVSFNGADNLPNGLVLCGANTGQHVYLDYGNDECPIRIQANLQDPSSKYEFLITMLECDSPLKAPTGCTQYFTTGRSTVTSFNYPQQQLNSERYSVCVNSPGNEITWTPCENTPTDQPFLITGFPNPYMPPQPGPVNCPTDFVMIPPNNRICGSRFPTTISTAKPFIMYVNLDDNEMPEDPPHDPDTGCPMGYMCNPIPPAGQICPEGGSCLAPVWWSALVDDSNTGFCLTFSVA